MSETTQAEESLTQKKISNGSAVFSRKFLFVSDALGGEDVFYGNVVTSPVARKAESKCDEILAEQRAWIKKYKGVSAADVPDDEREKNERFNKDWASYNRKAFLGKVVGWWPDGCEFDANGNPKTDPEMFTEESIDELFGSDTHLMQKILVDRAQGKSPANSSSSS